MKPLHELGAPQGAAIHTFITDIDDTLTTDGVLTAAAYAALESLHRHGLRVIVTTGRPAGWCDHIARMWPVDAVVAENGACAYWYDRANRRLAVLHSLREDQLVATRARLQAVAQQVLRQVPGTALASDQFARLYDLAIDYCEDVPHIGQTAVQRIVELMVAEGMQAKVSSIHVNGWFGNHDKLSMSRRIAHELFGLDIDAERSRIIYAGDSPNDAPMFAHFDHSVGVANVLDFVDQLDLPPRYVTRNRSGEGFREIAERLLALRLPGTTHPRP